MTSIRILSEVCSESGFLEGRRTGHVGLSHSLYLICCYRVHDRYVTEHQTHAKYGRRLPGLAFGSASLFYMIPLTY